jgi:hypothetical protein
MRMEHHTKKDEKISDHEITDHESPGNRTSLLYPWRRKRKLTWSGQCIQEPPRPST